MVRQLFAKPGLPTKRLKATGCQMKESCRESGALEAMPGMTRANAVAPFKGVVI